MIDLRQQPEHPNLMTPPLHHPHERQSNETRDQTARYEPKTLRTFTPTQAVLARSSGVFHWTPEGRRLFDFSSGVLVANLGHNPTSWMKRFVANMGWNELNSVGNSAFFSAVPMNAYNAATPIEIQ